MGSHSGELARARHASSLLVNTLPRQGPRYLQWPGLYSTRMNFLKIVASLLLLVSTCLSSPLHIRARRSDGYNDVGGVYNSAIAQDYWAARFGSGFFCRTSGTPAGWRICLAMKTLLLLPDC